MCQSENGYYKVIKKFYMQNTTKSSRNFTCRRCEGTIGEAVKHEDKLCDEVETVRGFTYLGDMVSVGGNVRLL